MQKVVHKKNKGFTLIELMAVLIILSILILIAVPSVNNWLNQSREDVYRTQINNIVLATRDWASENPFSVPKESGDTITITLGQLKMNGKLELDFKNPKTQAQFPNDMEIVIKRDGTSLAFEVLESTGTPVSNEDPINITPLTLVLVGSSNFYVEINTPFLEPGVIAKKIDGSVITDVDYEITQNDTVVSSINTGQLGQYKIKYTISDGGQTLSVLRTVTIRDTTGPVITFPTNTIISVEQANASYNLMAGVSATDNSGNSDITITATGVLSSVPGNYQITYFAEDASGNVSSAVRTITVADLTAPTVTFGTNGNSTWAQSRSTSVTVNDNVGVNGSSLRYLWSLSATGITESNITQVFTSGSTLTSQAGITGDYYLWILAKDTAGNTTVLRSNVFRLDNTPPVITRNGNASITITVGSSYTDAGASVTDAHSGVTGGVTTTGTVNVNVPGTYTITYNKSDNAGNAATAVTRTVIVQDNVAPTVTFGTNGNATWAQNRSSTVQIADAHSTVNTSSLRYLWSTAVSGIVESNFVTTFTNGANITTTAGLTGDYYLWILAKDSAGNTAIVRSNVFKLDNTLPTLSGITNTTITVQQVSGYNLLLGITGADAHSGVNASGVVVSGTLSAIPGSYNITYTVTDHAGNVRSQMRTITVMDSQAPVITLVGLNPMNINIGTPYVEPGATAIDDVDGNFTNGQITKTGTVNINVHGTYTITYTVADSAGNIGSATRTVNVIDNIIPSVTFGTDGNSTWAQNRSTTVTVTDHSSLPTLRYQWLTTTTTPTEGSFTTTFTNGSTINSPAGVSGNYYLWILAKDNVGNTTIIRTNVFYLDNTRPVITLNGSANVTVNAGSAYTDAGASVTDAHSGVTGGVTTTGTVNTNVPGTYTITYNKSDNAGNAALTVTRTVTVQDTTAPTVTFGTNGNATWAKTRSTTVAVSDAHGSVNASSLRYLWTTTASGITEGNFGTSFTSGGTINSPAAVTGDYYLWILAKDNVGNTSIIRSNVFKLDNTIPEITQPGNATITISQVSGYNLMSGVTGSDSHSGLNASGVVVSGTLSAIPGNYTITYTATDQAGNIRTVTRTITVQDVSAPVITISGNNPVTISAGSSYTDAGATAFDDVDGNLTSSISVNSNVNVNVVGTYQVTYNVTDSSGNLASSIRVVNVIDTTGPVIAFGTNGNSSWAKIQGSSVTVTDAHSSINAGSLRYLWSTADTGIIEANFTLDFLNGASINKNTETGNYYLWILAKDSVGNMTITRSSIFRIDNTPPVIALTGSATMSLNLGQTYTEPGATVSDAHSGVTGNVTISGNVNTNVPGVYTITYTKNDNAGNAAVQVTRTVTVIDNIAPVVTFGTNGNATFAPNHSTVVTVTDHSSLPTLRYQWTTSTTAPSEASFSTTFISGNTITTPVQTGAYYLWILAKDSAGNTTITRTAVFNLDNVNPVISFGTNGNPTVSKTHATTVTITDSNSGVNTSSLRYQWTTSTTAPVEGTFTTTFTNGGSISNATLTGSYYLWILAKDNAGNTMIGRSNVFNFDNTNPVITRALAGGMINTDPTFASGLNGTSVYNNTGNGNVSRNRVSMADSPTGSGYGLEVISTGTASPGWGGFYFATPTAVDKVYITRIIAKIPVGRTLNWASNSIGTGGSSMWLTPTAGTGQWTEYVYQVNAGNSGTFSSTNFFYLSGGATPTVESPLTWHVAYATVYDTTRYGAFNNIVSVATDTNGIVGYGINQSSTVEPTYTNITSTTTAVAQFNNMTANGTYYVWFKDVAGNINNQAVTINYTDVSLPTVTFGTNGNATWAQNRSTTVTASDTGSGINASTLRYQWTTSTTTPTESSFGSNTFTNGGTISSPTAVTGDYYLWILAKDNVGNTTIARTNVFKIDNTLPTLSGVGNTTITIAQVSGYNLLTGISGADAHSGVNGSGVQVSGSLAAIPGTYNITYTVTDNAGNVRTQVRVITVIDSQAPIITLIGSNPININVGTAYTEPGATATDDVDGTFSNAEINKSGTVNVNVPGTYTITYSVTDSSGNVGTTTRTVNVIDNIPPSVSFNPNGGVHAKTHASTVVVTDTHSSVPIRKYLWGTSKTTQSEVITNGVNFTSNSTLTHIPEANTSYSYYLNIYVEDSAGNSTYAQSNWFNFDNIPPVITLNGNPTITINVGSTYTDLGATVTDAHSGVTGGVTATGTVNTNVPGTYTITYNKSDNAGNAALPVNRTVIVVDNTPPSVVFGTNGHATWAQSRNTTVTVSDAHSSVNTSSLRYLWSTASSGVIEGNFSTSFTNGGTLTSPGGATGDYYLWILAKDSANNTAIIRSNVFKLDNTPPVITRTGSSSVNLTVGQSYTDAGATVTDAHSGVTGSVTATGTVNVNIPGTYTITYNKSDNAGNAATPVTRTVIVADNVPPTVAFGTNGNTTWAKTRTTTVTATDAHSSINASSLRYLWTSASSGVVEVNFSSSFTNGATITTPAGLTGDYYLWILAKDVAGNTTIVRTNVFKLDNQIPTFHLGAGYTTVQGVSTYDLMTGIVITEEHSGLASVTTSGNLAAIPGAYLISYTATDYAGNTITVSRYIDVYDVQSPVITLNGNNPIIMSAGSAYNEPGATAVDDVDGNFTNAQITKTGTVNVNVPGSYTIIYRVYDSSGNLGQTTRSVIVEDTTAPTVTFGTNGSTTWAQSHGTSVTVNDPHSGVNTSSLRYQWSTAISAPLESTFINTFTNGGTVTSGTSYSGYFYLWILAKDNAGNTAMTRSTNPFYLDNVPPVLGTNWGGGIGGATVVNDVNLQITYSIDPVTESHSGLAPQPYLYQISMDGSIWETKCSLAPRLGSCTIPDILPDTLYYYRACVIDNAGNQSCLATKTITTEPLIYVDGSGASAPELSNGMIPVRWNGNSLQKANVSQEWYNYNNKQWANAVLVNDTTRSTYQSAAPGTVVNEADILAYFVWIPRYRYQLFNVASLPVEQNPVRTINLSFESRTTSKSNGTSNDQWRTHPAFTFGTRELNGFWSGKFETTGNATTPTIKPNITSLKNQNISVQWNTARLFSTTSTYGLATENDAHMMKNTEWGAVAYLSRSTYGKDSEVSLNSNTSYLTGGGAYLTRGTQSTTGNTYGVYDMNGGSDEYVMGNYNKVSASSGINFTTLDEKYYDLYTGTTYSSIILGDATGETNGWYIDSATFINESQTWFLRGRRYYDNSFAGPFAFISNSGFALSTYSFRVVVLGPQ